MTKIFLSILVVSILIITVVGATFAFFSASGGSANAALKANATTLANLGFTSSNSKVATNLVPVHSESEFFSRYPGTGASDVWMMWVMKYVVSMNLRLLIQPV